MRIKLGIPFSGLFGGKPITHITTDSREASEGDLFFPIKGKYQDGNNYTNDAISRGAYVAPFSLLKFASDYKKRLPRLIHTVAITGSVGKTTTKEFLRRISEKQYTTHATDGNYNNEIGLALSILTAPEETEVLILEMGANAPGEISRLSKCPSGREGRPFVCQGAAFPCPPPRSLLRMQPWRNCGHNGNGR